MTSCEEFLESLDAYMDGELSAEEIHAADAHRRQCPSCRQTVVQWLEARQVLKQLANTVEVSPQLEHRVLRSVAPWWHPFVIHWVTARRAVALLSVAVVILAVAVVGRTALHARAANTLDRLAISVDESSAVVVEGTVLCRDCELTRRYGIESSCRRIGHHGAIFTDDGVILNVVEQNGSTRLVHDESLFGKRVVVHGHLLRGARAVSVDSFEIEG
jgi:hypothetical protein